MSKASEWAARRLSWSERARGRPTWTSEDDFGGETRAYPRCVSRRHPDAAFLRIEGQFGYVHLTAADFLALCQWGLETFGESQP